MKKHFALVPIALLSIVLYRQYPVHRNPQTSTLVYVETGSRGASCSGGGVCSITPPGGGQAPPPPGYKATLGYEAPGKLFLELRYEDIPPSIYAVQFNDDAFAMQSDCPIPASILKLIGAPDTMLSLKTGMYPTIKTAQSVRITF